MSENKFNPDIGKNTRFTSENQPPNKGKKKGTKNLTTIIRELEDEEFDWSRVPVSQKEIWQRFGSPWRAIAAVALAKACGGDIRAAEWLAKFAYGEKLRMGGVESDEVKIIVVNEEQSVEPE